jgi:hypothetical protein
VCHREHDRQGTFIDFIVNSGDRDRAPLLDYDDSLGNDFDIGPHSKRKKSNRQQYDPRQYNLSPTGQLQCDGVGVECSFACLGSTDVATTPALSTPATDSSRVSSSEPEHVTPDAEPSPSSKKRRYSGKSPEVESSEVLLFQR